MGNWGKSVPGLRHSRCRTGTNPASLQKSKKTTSVVEGGWPGQRAGRDEVRERTRWRTDHAVPYKP